MSEVLVNVKISGVEKLPELDQKLDSVTKSSNKTTNAFTEMRKEMKQAKADMLTFAEGTPQYTAAMQKAAAGADKLRDMTDKVKAAQKDVGVVAKNVSGAVSGMAGAFSTAQGVIALFGIENANTAKAILKIQSTMAITSGIAQFADSLDNMKDLYHGLKINIMAMVAAKQAETVVTVENTVANGAEAVAVTAVGTASKVTGKAMLAALGPYALVAAAIAAVVTGIVLLIKKMNEIPESVKLKVEMESNAIEKTEATREKIMKWQYDYTKAQKSGNTDQLTYLETLAKKEFGISDDRLKAIKRTKDGWDAYFKEYIKTAEVTYYNEAIIKKKAEAQILADEAYSAAANFVRQKWGANVDVAEAIKWMSVGNSGKYASGGVDKQIQAYVDKWKAANKTIADLPAFKQMDQSSYFNTPPAATGGSGSGKQRTPTKSGFSQLKPDAITLPGGFVPSSGAGTTPTPATTDAMNVGASQVVTEGESTLDMIDRLAGKANEYLSQLGGTFSAIAQMYEANMSVTDAFYDNEAARINASITDNDAREAALQANEEARYEALKKDFEKQKMARIAMAVIEGASGVVGAIASAAPLGPVGWALGAAQAAAIIFTTAANIKAINAEKLNAPSKAAATNTQAATVNMSNAALTPKENSMTTSEENLNMMQQSGKSPVQSKVLVSDINEVQKKVSVRDSNSSY